MRRREAYGLICLDRKRRKTLVIQLLQTPDYIHFLRGTYNINDLPCMLENCTEAEHISIKELLTLPKDRLHDEILKQLPKYYPKDLAERYADQGCFSIELYRDDILDLFNHVQPALDQAWIWPKGGMEQRESPVECAIRETYEETGYKIPLRVINTRDIITLSIATFSGRVISNSYFIAEWDSEVEPDSKPDFEEVQQAGWYSYDFLINRMPTNYAKFLASCT